MRHSSRILISSLVLAAAIWPGVTASYAEVRFTAHGGNPPPLPDCTWRFNGQNLPLAALPCLRTPDGPRMAESVREVNLPSGRPSRQPRPQGYLVQPRPRA